MVFLSIDGLNATGVGLLELLVEGARCHSRTIGMVWSEVQHFLVSEPQDIHWLVPRNNGCTLDGTSLTNATDEGQNTPFTAFPNPISDLVALESPRSLAAISSMPKGVSSCSLP